MQQLNPLRWAREFISAQNGKVAPLPVSEEELNPDTQQDLSHQVYPLEPTTSCYRVNYTYPDDSDCSEFSFFEDGKQRTVQIGHIPTKYGSTHVLIPVHFFVVAAVILKRENHELRLWEAPEIQQGILVGKSLVPNQSALERFEKAGLRVVDSEERVGDYYDLRRCALEEAKKLRLDAENRLISKWRDSKEAADQFLVVDGTLMNLRNEKNVQQCVGVSKSFGSRYFPVSENHRIMQMNEFERSWIFRFHSPENEGDDLRLGPRERVSWYLRLRSRAHSDPEFGLVRVEISYHYAKTGEASQLAERFSRSLLSERLPIAYPRPRWDKHLYPIQECENYLASVMPSIATIKASMGG